MRQHERDQRRSGSPRGAPDTRSQSRRTWTVSLGAVSALIPHGQEARDDAALATLNCKECVKGHAPEGVGCRE